MELGDAWYSLTQPLSFRVSGLRGTQGMAFEGWSSEMPGTARRNRSPLEFPAFEGLIDASFYSKYLVSCVIVCTGCCCPMSVPFLL
jgi:hypothetical protein